MTDWEKHLELGEMVKNCLAAAHGAEEPTAKRPKWEHLTVHPSESQVPGCMRSWSRSGVTDR